MHQSQLPPAANKFHVGNGDDGKHYWLTPPELYAEAGRATSPAQRGRTIFLSVLRGFGGPLAIDGEEPAPLDERMDRYAMSA